MLLALLAVQLFFATTPVAVEIALRELSAPALAQPRMVGAALLFVLLHRLLSGELYWGRHREPPGGLGIPPEQPIGAPHGPPAAAEVAHA